MKYSILILGGTGFIGYHLAKESLKRGFDVTSISKNHPKKKRFLKKINYIKGNINNKNFLKKNIKDDFKYVVNLAGYVDHSNKKKILASHYLGCKKLSRILLKKNIKSFVHIGSSMEYGHVNSPQKENSKCLPKSIYGKAKLLASKYLLDLFKRKNFPVTILRLYQVYGPYQDINRFIPIVINSCLKNKKFPCSHGNQYRDFLYIDDLISAIFLALKNKNSNGKIINIGSAKPQKIKNIINMIVNYYKSGVPQFGKISLRKEEAISVFPDITNAKKILKWEPKFNFKNGLKKTIEFYNEKKNNIYPLVSIIMNCYNGEKYLKDSIISIINQKFTDWELIFWDNNSTDNSGKIFKCFKDERFKYFKTIKHTTLYKARNCAIKKCKGKFIAFCDVDDLWLPDKLDEQIKEFNNTKVGFVYSNFYIQYDFLKLQKLYSKFKLPEGNLKKYIFSQYKIGILTVMLRKSLFLNQNYRFNDYYSIIGDFDLFTRLAQIAEFKYIHKPLAIYRQHGSNFSSINYSLEIKELKHWLDSHDKRDSFVSLSFIKEKIKNMEIVLEILNGDKKKAYDEISNIPFNFNKIKFIIMLIIPAFFLKKIKNIG